MDPALISLVEAALGIASVVPLMPGGQKQIATADSGGQTVMVKIIELRPPYAAVARERATREVELLRKVAHPNVVRVLSVLTDVGNPPTHVAWLEEQLLGQDLRLLLGTPWDWPQTKRLAQDVLAALRALHAEDAIHRDLSPGNVRALPDGRFVVMDPGLARWLTKTTITGPTDPGTPGYMSPEHVIPTARPTAASDIFELGVLLFEALSGQQPIPYAGDFTDYATRLRDTQAPSISTLRPDLSPQQSEFVDTMLARQLPRRFLDTDEAETALAAL